MASSGCVLILPADGRPARFYRADRPLSLRRAQRIVGGYVEPVPGWGAFEFEGSGGRQRAIALCNKLDDLPINEFATLLWYRVLGERVGDYLVGNVVVLIGDVHFTDEEGWGQAQ